MKFVADSRFLSHVDISDTEDTVVTIKANAKEMVGRGVEAAEKHILQFKELKKPFILNKTNGKLLVRLFGTEEMDAWTGRKIALYVKDDVEFQGDVVSAIRVRPTLPGTPKKDSSPFSVEAFMVNVDRASTFEGLRNLIRDLNEVELSEDDRVSLTKYVFSKMDGLKEGSKPHAA
jgi:hypothetical protein